MKPQSISAVRVAAPFILALLAYLLASASWSGERPLVEQVAAEASASKQEKPASAEGQAGSVAPDGQASRPAREGPQPADTKKPAKSATSSAPAKAQPATPPLDLELLEKRLKETEAIGFFTKLTLKNEVDSLLERFRSHYEGRSNSTLAELRPSYDMLILKALSLLQDADPSLAKDIAKSREAIWNILTDREQFAKI